MEVELIIAKANLRNDICQILQGKRMGRRIHAERVSAKRPRPARTDHATVKASSATPGDIVISYNLAECLKFSAPRAYAG